MFQNKKILSAIFSSLGAFICITFLAFINMKDVSNLSDEEKKGIHAVLDIAITNLSEHIKKKGGKWNWIQATLYPTE